MARSVQQNVERDTLFWSLRGGGPLRILVVVVRTRLRRRRTAWRRIERAAAPAGRQPERRAKGDGDNKAQRWTAGGGHFDGSSRKLRHHSRSPAALYPDAADIVTKARAYFRSLSSRFNHFRACARTFPGAVPP